MPGYGQFCPVAKAMEILDERWTLLVVRELLLGSRHFNELRRGVPRMSPALLSKRLKSLERAGVVTRTVDGQQVFYDLTPAGRELFEVVNGLGLWGMRWISELGDADLDPHLLMWDIRRTIPTDQWPPKRTTVAIRFSDNGLRDRNWWVVVADGEADVCDVDPGFEVDVDLDTTLRTLTRIWRGDESWDFALGHGHLVTRGAERRQVPQWFGESMLAQHAHALHHT